MSDQEPIFQHTPEQLVLIAWYNNAIAWYYKLKSVDPILTCRNAVYRQRVWRRIFDEQPKAEHRPYRYL